MLQHEGHNYEFECKNVASGLTFQIYQLHD